MRPTLSMNPKASAYPIRLLEAELHALRMALEHGDMDKVGRIWRSAALWRSGDVVQFSGELPIMASAKPTTRLKARPKPAAKRAAKASSRPVRHARTSSASGRKTK